MAERNDSSQVRDLIQPDESSEMAGRNDSSQVRDLIQFDESSGQARSSSSTSPSSSPTQPSCSADVSSRRVEAARMQTEKGSSSSCPLNKLKYLRHCDLKLGRLTFSRTHSVLVDVDDFNCGKGAVPQEGKDMWHGNFVKMPNSPSNMMVVKSGLKQQTSKRRWDVISKKLRALAEKTTASAEDVENAIMKYNPKYKGQWSFDALYSFVKVIPKTENDLTKLFPKIAALALKLPEYVKKGLPLLKKGNTAAVTLSQVQVACLLANAFFCTFPHRNATGANAEYGGYPSINFTRLFGQWSSRKKEKLRAVLHYFHVMTDELKRPNGLVTFERRYYKATDLPNWRSCEEKMNELHVTSGGTIETEGAGLLQVDFASSWIGGGVLGSGLVQEEILFLLNPELIVSRLFTEKLGDTECLIVTGSQQFSRYSGYGDSFQWAGHHRDHLDRDEWDRQQRRILAIDAINFKHQRDQYNMTNVTRELNKAYCGFKRREPDEPDIATGKWGCGVFNGDPQLKAVIQLMAAARAKRGLAFFTFRDEELTQGLQRTHHTLVTDGATVGHLYKLLEDYCAVQKASGDPHVDLFQFISNTSRSRL